MIRPDGASWSGVRDRFGERATGVGADGRSVDLLRLFDAFTPAARPLLDRITLLDVERPAVSRAIALERDEDSGRLILVSEHVPGVRLSELLRTAVQRSVVADLGAALFVMRQLLMLAESLEAATGLAHFLIAPERIVITPHGRVVIVEPALAAAAETVGLAPNDIAGIAIAGMSMMLGHFIENAEHIDPMSPVLQDAADVAAIRAGHRFSIAIRLWFDRAIVADPSMSFPDFRQARLGLSRVGLVRESACDASRRNLKAFLNDLAIDGLTEGEAGILEVTRLRDIRATRIARRKAISAPDEEWISVEDELFLGDPSRLAPEPILGALVDRIDERADETIEIGSLAEPERDAPAEETIEAVRVEETVEAVPIEEPFEPEPVPEMFGDALVDGEPVERVPAVESIEADPAPSSDSWFRSLARQLDVASADTPPLQADVAAPLEDVPLEGFPAEQSSETLPGSAAAEVEVAAESSIVSSDPLLGQATTESSDALGEEGLDEIDEEPIEIEEREQPVGIFEEPFAEDVQPVSIATPDQSPRLDAAIEQAEPPIEVTQEAAAVSAEEDESAPIDAEAVSEPDIFERPSESLTALVSEEYSSGWTEPERPEFPTAGLTAGERPAGAVADDSFEPTEPEVPSETIETDIEEDEPAAPADETIAARLAEEAHRSWIQSITEQLGRMRRDEGVGGVTETPVVPAPHVQPEQAAMPKEQERTEQRAAWAGRDPAPWSDEAKERPAPAPFPAEPVEREYAPHPGALHQHVAPEPHRPDAHPARVAPIPRAIELPPRRWIRAAARILMVGLGLAIIAALAIAGRSYYRSATAPGTLAVDSTPSGSEVLVDGTARGVTPLTLTLQPGDHVLALRRNGLTRQFTIAVTPGARLSQQLDWSTVRATGTLAIRSTPSQANVTVDGKARGVTPLTLSDVPVGLRRIVIESSAGTVSREVRVVAGSQVTIDETIISGWIAAFAPFELQIYDGTRLLGAMEDGRIRMPPGRHELDFVNTRLGFRERRAIDVNPGMTTAVNIGAVVGIVRITAPAGADVLIDGVLFGDTPIRELRLPIGAHEIVLRHPQLGEQRVSVTVGASAPTEVSVDFTKR
jgi:hypothetical protein